MRRGAKPGKAKVVTKRPRPRTSPKDEAFKRHELEKRLAESLAQQAATAEILRVISSSPTDVQPVFDTIVRNAGRVCDAIDAVLSLREENELTVRAHWGPIGVQLGRRGPLTEGSVNGRTILAARPIHVEDLSTASEFPEGRELALRWGHRTTLGVPLLREGEALGALLIRRTEARPFSDTQIAMLQTFADQAVIAIENVRLFNETKEALEQQTATSEILKVIASSPTDVQPVFDAIARHAVALCDGVGGMVVRYDGAVMRLAAFHNVSAKAWELHQTEYPRPPDRTVPLGAAIVDRTIVHVPNLQASTRFAGSPVHRSGRASMIAVPLLRHGEAIGAIGITRDEPEGFSDRDIALLQTFADQAVIAIENVRLFNETKEALEQQTATSEILKVISASPTDIQPVFDIIAANAARLCVARDAQVLRVEGDVLRLVSAYGSPSMPPVRAISRGHAVGRAVIDRQTIHVRDMAQAVAEFPETSSPQHGVESLLAVPLLREDVAVGLIRVSRTQIQPFTEQQIALLRTFADQAVIAIENVRLFKELQAKNADLTEALEQQTATAEVLRVISTSPTNIQPVLDTLAASAARFCGSYDGSIFQLEGDILRLVAHHGPLSSHPVGLVVPLVRGAVMGRSVLDRTAIHVTDLQAETEEFPQGSAIARDLGFHTLLSVPLLREGAAIGAIGLRRIDVNPFTDKQVALAKTFADQAVIAIENVRLFTELQTSNRDLTTALDTQTATSDILRVISRSQTNVQPVFDAIVASAVRLLGAYTGALTRVVGDQLAIAALTGHDAAAAAVVRAAFPMSLQSDAPLAQAIRDRGPLNIADYATDPRLPEARRASAAIRGYRSLVGVPMFLHDEAVGTISVTRREPGGFSDDEIALLQTFADQAVIAIENARLLSELQQKNDALTQAHAQVSEALEQQTATAEILRVISRSPTDVQPVFDAIVRSASQLCDGADCIAVRFDGELMHLMARHNPKPGTLESVAALFPRRPSRSGTATDRAILEGHMVHVPDVLEDPTYDQRRVRAAQLRSLLSVPLMRAGNVIGAISPSRAVPGLFSDRQVELLKTFADQAVIAIENVRLFKELEARTAELTHSVEQLTALGEVGRAVSSTLDLETVLTTIVSRAVELSRLDGGVVFEYEEAAEEFVHRAATETGGALAEARRATHVRKGEGVVGRTAITLEPVQVPDITMPGAHESRLRENLIESGVRAILAVPMVREGRLIGSLVVSRNQPGDFPTETIELLRTFATQSALAIQNARLFHEIADKSRQLEAASRHKSEFLANMSHELRTPLNAIIGFSEVLVDRMFGELTEKQDEYLKDIYASGQHLLSLINDILDLSKIEAGRMELEATDFDLPSAIDNALILVRERVTRRGITLGRTIDERLGTLRGDERKVKQVLLNLLSNALKFTPEGGRIDVSARLQDGAAEIAVADTGVGIAPEDQEAVFEEFRQVGTADKKVEGTGLGLALSRKFIELHGGRIWVKSQVGHGSTFTFTLPVRREE